MPHASNINLACIYLPGLQPHRNYFRLTQGLLDKNYPHAQQSYQTFSTQSTAFHLTCDPTFCDVSIDEAATKFGLTDFCPALADFQKSMEILHCPLGAIVLHYHIAIFLSIPFKHGQNCGYSASDTMC